MDDDDDDLVFVGTSGNMRQTRSDDLIYVGTIENRRQTRSVTRRNRSQQNKEPPVIDTIDLDDTPKNDKENVPKEKKKILVDGWLEITVDSDDFEEEDEESRLEEIKAIWYENTSKIERFSLKRTDPLLPVFKYFANLSNTELDKIFIQTNNYQQIHQYDSIETLNFKVTNFLIASIKKTENNVSNGKNMVEVKCQFKDIKKPLMCSLHRNQPFLSVAEKCALQMGCNVEKIKLYFDGDIIRFEDTPTSLDFDGGECIDVKMI